MPEPRAVSFAVRGLPVAQGSPSAFSIGGKARVVSGASGKGSHGRKLASWRSDIATEARRAMRDDPAITGPVSVRALFVCGRPASHYLPANRRRPAPELRDDAPVWVTTSPDLDKLCRALLDALTGVVLRDDRQVVALSATQRYETAAEPPGVAVWVTEIERR